MNELLSISIPTHNRSKYLAALLLSINKQYNEELSKLIHIYIHDNNSDDETEYLLNKIDMKFGYTYLKHDRNMGGLYNVYYSYTKTNGKYTWVIGDDEIIPENSLEEIIRIIKSYSPGLVITKGSIIDPLENSPEFYKNYIEFASDCLKLRPHILIAHSLISANVIRSDCFDREFAKHKFESVYSHFYAIVNGIIDQNIAVVNAKKFTLIVRPKRAPMEIERRDSLSEIFSEVFFEQNKYLNWLLKKLRNNKKTNLDILNSCESRLNQIWKLSVFNKRNDPKLKTIQSMIFDNELNEYLLNKNIKYKKIRDREKKSIKFTCDMFDRQALSLFNSGPNDMYIKDDNSSHQSDAQSNLERINMEEINSNIENTVDEIPISLSLSVYNEEKRIFYVLASALTWADEVIVFNKSSTDRTKDICLQFGEKVKIIDVPFSPAGHDDIIANSKVPANDWIYFATASEIPTKKLIKRIRQILKDSGGGLDLVYVPRKYFSLGIHDKRSPWSISYFPFLINRKKTIITNTIHKNFRPSDPSNTRKIEYADDCCAYHLTHPTAKDYLRGMTHYFELEAEGCENPAAKIQECMANIAKFEKQLRNGGNDLLGHYFAWQIYWLGTALFVWEKWRGIDVKRFYNQLRKTVIEREWFGDDVEPPHFPEKDAPKAMKTEKAPMVSAIVSTCNSERFMRGCMEDLEAQTINDKLEIIVVDSASEQNEKAIVEEFQKRYSNIKYIRTEQRETVYAAWNRAIKAASGKYITNANTDDRHVPYAFERMVHVLEKNPDISLVYADVWITEKENETFESFTLAGRYCWKDFDPKTLIDGCYIGPQPMWRKNVHETHGYFDEQFHSAGDWEFWLRICQDLKFLHLHEFLGLYLKSTTSVEHRDVELTRRETRLVHQRYATRKREGKSSATEKHKDAQRLLNSGRIEEAKAAYLRLLDVHPNLALAHNDLGVLYLNENDLEGALKHYKKAAELEPENVTFLKNLADFYYVKLGEAEVAMEIYVKLLAKNAEDVELLTAIGHICITLGEYDNAKDFFCRILKSDPSNQDVKRILNELAKMQGMVTTDQEQEMEGRGEDFDNNGEQEESGLHSGDVWNVKSAAF